MCCTDFLHIGHSTNKHSTIFLVSKHHAGIGNEGDITGSPASKCHFRTTTEFDETSDSNIKHIRDRELAVGKKVFEETCASRSTMEKHVVADSNDNNIYIVHDSAHHFEGLNSWMKILIFVMISKKVMRCILGIHL